MATSRGFPLVRDPRRAQRATYVELFYDLVFVFTLARLAETLIESLHLLGAYEALLLLLAIWWVWSYTNLATDTLNSDRPAVQIVVIGMMFGSLILSIAIPEAFDGKGLLFASAYVGIHLGRSITLAFILHDHRLHRRPLRGIFWFGISGLIWIAGALAPGLMRVWLWTLALAVDYITPFFRWPTPKVGRSPAWEWNTAGEHLAERYRQFIIIALGETIVTTARTLRRGDFTLPRSMSFGVAFVLSVLLWWIYFYRTREKLGTAFAAAADPGHESKWAAYAHLVMVGGIVLTGVADELAISHPLDHNKFTWVIVIIGGPALFLAGRALLGHEVFVHVARPWLVGMGVLIVAAPVMVLLPPIGTLVVTTGTVLGIVLADALSGRERAAPG